MKANQQFSKVDLKAIYDEHFEGLRRFLYYKCGEIQLAEDLVQEVFIKVWEKRLTIRRETVKSLLFTMANNLFIFPPCFLKSKLTPKFVPLLC